MSLRFTTEAERRPLTEGKWSERNEVTRWEGIRPSGRFTTVKEGIRPSGRFTTEAERREGIRGERPKMLPKRSEGNIGEERSDSRFTTGAEILDATRCNPSFLTILDHQRRRHETFRVLWLQYFKVTRIELSTQDTGGLISFIEGCRVKDPVSTLRIYRYLLTVIEEARGIDFKYLLAVVALEVKGHLKALSSYLLLDAKYTGVLATLLREDPSAPELQLYLPYLVSSLPRDNLVLLARYLRPLPQNVIRQIILTPGIPANYFDDYRLGLAKLVSSPTGDYQDYQKIYLAKDAKQRYGSIPFEQLCSVIHYHPTKGSHELTLADFEDDDYLILDLS